jgi:apolipoprotein N-acyltransferase
MNTSKNGRHEFTIAAAVFLSTALLHTVAFPFAFVGGRLLCVPECAYVLLVPLTVWMMRRRKISHVAWIALLSFSSSWLVLLFWLRHVTMAGTIALAVILALFPTVWAIAASKILPDFERRPAGERFAIICGLAGAWVVLEWVRTWIFSGFPWLPLAASQWSRPAMLQILSVTGWSGLSWMLAFFNLALASYAMRLANPSRQDSWVRKLLPELYAALAMVAGCAAVSMSIVWQRSTDEELFRAGIVQPYVPGMLKWNLALAQDNIARLEKLTSLAGSQDAEIVFWPESSTPWPVVSENPTMRQWVEQICGSIAVPIVMGNMADIEGKGRETYYNGIFVVSPQTGLAGSFYAKRKLVPFGEYNPFDAITPNFISGHMDFFSPGKNAQILTVDVGGRALRFGSLVCYEDVFPSLARSEARQGTDFFYVATNNAWYGEETGAYQHAVHSILRAVENRRPVLRCGNGGWSGAIDEYGFVRSICERPGMGVYYEGVDVIPLVRDPSWKGRMSLYTQWGDWFVAAAFVMALGSIIVSREKPTTMEPVAEPDKIDKPDIAPNPKKRKIADI